MLQSSRIKDSDELLNSISNLMWKASDVIMAIYQQNDFGETMKSDKSPITQADLAGHYALIQGLAILTPEIPVVSEEDADSVAIGREQSCYWLIDPLDGTKEFINRNDEFTCNLALIEDHRPTLGFVSVPTLELLYIGGPGYQSQRINRAGLATSLIPEPLFGVTRVVASKSHLNEETKGFIDGIAGNVELVQAGSSLKFLKIAEGLADIYPRLGPTCEWDTAAAHAVVSGVGGTVTDLNYGELVYGKENILNPFFVVRAPHFLESSIEDQ